MTADDGRFGLTAIGNRVVFEDAEGTRWSAREYDGRTIPGRRGDTCLIFESERAMRRVWKYPRDWQALPAVMLAALIWRR